MKEYFVVANSFAAPFFSDTEESYISGKNPDEAMMRFVKKYSHPCGLYAANMYENADAYHKGHALVCQWLCNAAKFNGKGDVKNPKDGSIVKKSVVSGDKNDSLTRRLRPVEI